MTITPPPIHRVSKKKFPLWILVLLFLLFLIFIFCVLSQYLTYVEEYSKPTNPTNTKEVPLLSTKTPNPIPIFTPPPTITATHESDIGQIVVCGDQFSIKILGSPQYYTKIFNHTADGIYMVIKYEITNLTNVTLDYFNSEEFKLESIDGNPPIIIDVNDSSFNVESVFGIKYYGEPIPPKISSTRMIVFDINPEYKNWILNIQILELFAFKPSCETRIFIY